MFRDQVKGMFLGVAYGDALGATVEKLSFDDIKARYGRVSTYKMAWHKSEWPPEARKNRIRGFGIFTDDTLMTMALMKVYEKEERHLDAYDLAKEFINQIYYETYYVPELQKETAIMERLFYPEQYIFTRHALANCEPREGGIGNMVNCGAAMYIAPIGAVNAGNPEAAYEEAIRFAMGHQNSYGLEAAGVLAACVAEALRPETTIDAILNTSQALSKDGTHLAIQSLLELAETLRPIREDKEKVVRELQTAIAQYSRMGDDVNRGAEKLGRPTEHYVPSRVFSIEELPIALFYIKLHEGDFEAAIFDGINSGRDTDSIGVMVGAILGAYYGSKIIDQETVEDLEKVNHYDLRGVSDSFSEAAEKIIRRDQAKMKRWITETNHLIGD